MPESPYGFWYAGEKSDPEEPEEELLENEVEVRLEIETSNGTFMLTASDSFVRTFEAGNGEFDHVIHQDRTTGQYIAIFLKGEDSAMREFFERNDFPGQQDDKPDEQTYDYFAQSVVKDMPDTFDFTN